MTEIRKLSLDRPQFPPGSLPAYLVALAIIAIATALRLTLTPWVSAVPFVTFFPAVILAIFLCGSAAGLAAGAASILSAWLFIIPPGAPYLSIYQTLIFAVGTITVVVVIGVMRAATADVHRLNETLRSSEEQFRSLLESAPDAMVILGEDRHILLVNAQTERLFGYPRGELLGQPIDLLLPERFRAEYLARLAAFLGDRGTTAKSQVIDLRGVRKDGVELPIAVSFAPLKTENGILVSTAIRDITARRQIEARLAKASAAKSDFLASVSHELRTPLNAIIGFSEMIRDAVIGPLDARYREYGGDINQAGRHLQNIINDILDISKIEGGRLELHEETVSIGETVETCRRIVAAMAETAGVALIIDTPESLPLLRSDQLRFRQILLNLMSNGVKFTPSGGRVTVSATVAADGITIVVADTGIGMRAEDIATALEPFRQIDGPLSRRFDGTGLGLPLAKALVELHGGRLEIESAPAAGTVARIRLPRQRLIGVAA